MTEKAPHDIRPILPGVSKTTDAEALKALRRFHVDPVAEPGGREGGVPEAARPAWFFAQREHTETVTPIAGSPLQMLVTAVRERLPAARQTFAAEARTLATALDGLLESDQRGSTGGAGGDLGDLGGRFVDPSALAGVVGERRGSAALPRSRRERLLASRNALAAFAGETPEPILVHRDSEPVPELWSGNADGEPEHRLRIEAAFDPCAAASERFDREADELARTLAAARRARLAAANEYDPGRHDLWLDRLSWRELSADELHLLPPVVVWVSADWLARGGMASLSRLLLSGRWVQVLVEVDPAEQPGGAGPGADPLTAYRFEAGYLGLGHREVFVQQGSMARPERLAEGFRRALAGTRPGLHVVAVTAETTGAAEIADATMEAALEARAHPIFRYDPEAGASWARRLDFTGNPAPEDDWPRAELPCRTAAGADEVLDLAFTFADYALLAPTLTGHFRLVPDGVPEAELTPLAVAVTRPVDEAPVLPFVWAVDGGGAEGGRERRLLRLAVSRPLLGACRDRLDLWRSLQELAGVRSEYVDEAVERLRGEMEGRFAAERQELEQRHAEALDQVRRTAAEEAANRMTAALLDLDLATVAGLGGAGTAAGTRTGTGAGDGVAGLSFAGQSPDQVAARLLEMVQPATLELDAATPATESDSAVSEMTEQLMKLVES